MKQSADSVLKIYLDLLNTPLMKWLTWISVVIVIVVVGIARWKGLSMWRWFVYSLLLGPIALIHILFKDPRQGTGESAGPL